MSQEEILKTLKKKKAPLTSRELSQYLEIRQETILKALRKLIKFNEVKSRPLTKEEIIDKGYEGKKTNSRFRVFFVDNK